MRSDTDINGKNQADARKGFGNVLWKGVREAVDANGFLGLFQGGFKACAVGVSAALIFGYLASVLFEPKMKKK